MEPQEKPALPKSNVMPTVKTFQADVADSVKSGGMSMVKMAIAESKKREQNTQQDSANSPTSKRNLIFIGGSILFIILAVGVSLFFYFSKSSDAPVVTPSIIMPDIIYAETTKKIDATGIDEKAIFQSIQDARQTDIKLGTVERLLFTNGPVKTAHILTAGELIDRLHTRIPPTLERSLDDNFFFALHSYNRNNPILILTTPSYQNAYAGMLEWEKNIKDDIGGLFLSQAELAKVGTTTQPTFQDRVINNKDTRALIDSNGNILLFYSFIDTSTLVVTTDVSTFGEVLTRFTKLKLIH